MRNSTLLYRSVLLWIALRLDILTKISTENALEYLAFGEEFIMDRLTGSKSKLKSLE